MNIGLTGGMGCGKSTVLELFRERGAVVFEADAFVRQALAEDLELIEEIRKAFGPTVFDHVGRVDRGRLGSIVFPESSKLSLLENLLHPRVRSAWLKEVEKDHPCLVVEIPLLFEKELQRPFDLTCCVVSHPVVQHQRLRSRQWSDADIQARLSRQWTLEAKAAPADVVIVNDGSRDHLAAQIDRILS